MTSATADAVATAAAGNPARHHRQPERDQEAGRSERHERLGAEAVGLLLVGGSQALLVDRRSRADGEVDPRVRRRSAGAHPAVAAGDVAGDDQERQQEEQQRARQEGG
jgi:hypothetical protein